QAQAQREPKVQPDRMGDDLLRETVTLVADGRFLHPTVSTHHSLTGGLRDNADGNAAWRSPVRTLHADHAADAARADLAELCEPGLRSHRGGRGTGDQRQGRP